MGTPEPVRRAAPDRGHRATLDTAQDASGQTPRVVSFRGLPTEKEGTMQDHLTDIFAYRDDLERDLAAVMEADPDEPYTTADGDEYETPAESLEGFALSCEVWDKRPTGPGHVHVGPYGYESHGPAGYESATGHIVEWLLGYGGPTVRLTYDTRWNHGELMHSWGADPRTGEPRDTIEVRGELCEWLAEWFGVTA